MLLLITAFRSYRILFRAVMYCLFIPGACLAEAFPCIGLSAIYRFAMGLLVWFALLVAAIVVAVRVDEEDKNSSSAMHARMSLLAIGSAMFGVLMLSAVSVSTRRIYLQPDSHSSVLASSLRFTWNHILALLTGPMESLQLSAVIMYFFWRYIRSDEGDDDLSSSSSSSSSSSMSSYEPLGSDSLSAVLMVWGNHHRSGSYTQTPGVFYDGGDRSALDISVLVASIAVFVWAIIIAIPLVWSSGADRERGRNATNYDHNRDKVLRFKGSALVEFLSVMLSRIFCVWIMATLMRTTSCLDHTTTSGGDDVTIAVVSTAQRVDCSHNHWWAAHSSLALLLFYMITSSILNADEADLLTNEHTRRSTDIHGGVVKFAPLYALWVRATQFFVCIACFSGFQAQSIYIPLLPVLFIVLLGIIPQWLMVTCSVISVGIFRTAGFVCVCWTTIVCIIRGAGTTTSIWSNESCIYVGWGVIYSIAIIIAAKEELTIAKRWEIYLQQSGLLDAITALVTFLNTSSTLEVFNEHAMQYTLSHNTRGLQYRVKGVEGEGGHASSPSTSSLSWIVNMFVKKVQSTRSMRDIATLLILLEEVRTYNMGGGL